jgi:hypothetical protein
LIARFGNADGTVYSVPENIRVINVIVMRVNDEKYKKHLMKTRLHSHIVHPYFRLLSHRSQTRSQPAEVCENIKDHSSRNDDLGILGGFEGLFDGTADSPNKFSKNRRRHRDNGNGVWSMYNRRVPGTGGQRSQQPKWQSDFTPLTDLHNRHFSR